MIFKINNEKWKIVELDTKKLCDRFNGEEDEFLYGFCSYTENIIYINNTLCQDRKKHTLIHELVHCWTFNNGWGFNADVSRENLCNIVAGSNHFINNIVNKYFGRKNKNV
jgi:Zn-dependent peptidase ImmA (M78 family)